MKPIIYLASDHAGFELKNELAVFVQQELGFPIIDCGATSYDPEDDFTTFIKDAASAVSHSHTPCFAIVLGGSGQGEAMLANRFHGVRASVYYGGELEIVRLSKLHNNANVLSLGARFLTTAQAKEAVALWLQTEHEKVPKYERRNEALEIQSLYGQEGTHVFPPFVNSIVPSLPAPSFAVIAELLTTLSGTITGVQIDLVDGMFAPAVSWPFTEVDVYRELRRLQQFSSSLAIEIDAMCLHIEQYLDVLAEIPISRLVIHEGATHALARCRAHANLHGYKLGLGIVNTTPLSVITENMYFFDYVQVMGIAKVGTQGQPFDERTYTTIGMLRNMYPQLEIAVDGAVNATTIVKLREAGANRFAPGSAVAKADNPIKAFTELAKLI